MAGDYVKWFHGLERKPKTVAIATSLRVNPVLAAGMCMVLWVWCDAQATTTMREGDDLIISIPGSADSIRAMIDGRTVVDKKGFAAAMESVGWLVITDGRLIVPGFWTHNGTTAKTRAENRERQQRKREKDRHGPVTDLSRVTPRDCHGNVTVAGHDIAEAEQSSREQNQRAEDKAAKQTPPVPSSVPIGVAPDAAAVSHETVCSMLLRGVPGLNPKSAAAIARLTTSKAKAAWAIERTIAGVKGHTVKNAAGYLRSLIENEDPPPGWVAEFNRKQLAIMGAKHAVETLKAENAGGAA